jgi:hypothetical protein
LPVSQTPGRSIPQIKGNQAGSTHGQAAGSDHSLVKHSILLPILPATGGSVNITAFISRGNAIVAATIVYSQGGR